MYHLTQLDNGVRVVTDEIPSVHSVALGFWIATGSRFEEENQAGLSHFLEHMLFKGTKTRSASEIAISVDEVGGQINAFTEKERTCYYVRLMNQHLERGVELLSDLILNSEIAPEELERERSVILEEMKMLEDSPDDRCLQQFMRSSFPKDSVGRPIIGYDKVVSEMKREDFVDYMSQHYTSSNLIVSAAGGVKHDEVVALVEKYLRDIPISKAPSRELVLPTFVNREPEIFYKDCEQVYVAYGGKGLSYIDETRYSHMVLDSVLGGSMSSRLFQEIREKRGLVYSVGTYQYSYSDIGTNIIFAGTSVEKVDELLEVTRDILDDIIENNLTSQEIRRGKELLKGNLALALESTSARMGRAARHVFHYGRVIEVDEVIARIESTTKEDVKRLASSLLDKDAYNLTVLGPVEKVDGIEATPLPELTRKNA